MSSLLSHGFHMLDSGVLRTSSILVPEVQRSEWLREWRGEFWHVRQECLPDDEFSWAAEREVTAFCLGSIADALCVRRQARAPAIPSPGVHGSAAQCILGLAVVLALCAVLAQLLPGVRSEFESARYQVRSGLLLIQDARSVSSSTPTITHAQFRDWRNARQRSFDGFAFYRILRDTAFLSSTRRSPWSVAHATPNLFSLLGFPIGPGAVGNDLPAVLLSHRAWVRDFRSDPHVTGRILRLAHTSARVAAVLPEGPLRLPGDPDAWVLEPSSQLESISSATRGYLIAHLSPWGKEQIGGDRVFFTAHGDEYDIDLAGISISPQSEDPWGTFNFALFLALLALPAVTSVTLSESNLSAHRPGLKRRLACWLFLAAKVVLVAAIAWWASLDIAYAGINASSQWGPFVQLIAGFVICLFGFRWALADQRERCPVCLRRVTHPARVGLASCTFLGWNGTELMCLGGHTLLHVPSLPTSWFGAPRWLYLDHTWDFLFANNQAA